MWAMSPPRSCRSGAHCLVLLSSQRSFLRLLLRCSDNLRAFPLIPLSIFPLPVTCAVLWASLGSMSRTSHTATTWEQPGPRFGAALSSHSCRAWLCSHSSSAAAGRSKDPPQTTSSPLLTAPQQMGQPEVTRLAATGMWQRESWQRTEKFSLCANSRAMLAATMSVNHANLH